MTPMLEPDISSVRPTRNPKKLLPLRKRRSPTLRATQSIPAFNRIPEGSKNPLASEFDNAV